MSIYRKDAAILLLLCALAITCWLPRLKGPIDLRWDGGTYYILGTSLAEGKGYRLLNEPGEIQGNQYPPLLPAIVAAHQLLLGTNDPVIVGQWLRITFFLSFLCYILAAYLMFRLFFSLTYALLATLVCLLHINTLFFSDLLFAELLFALTSTLFYICNQKSGKKSYDLLAVLLALASYALRTLGVALFAAWVGESLLKKDFKRALVRLTVGLVPIICWQAYVYSIESSEQYQSPTYEYQRADYMYPNVSYVRNTSLISPFAPEEGYVTLLGRIERFTSNLLRVPTKSGEAVSTIKRFWESNLDRLIDFLNLPPYSWLIEWFVIFARLTLGLLVIGGVILQIAKRQWFVPLYLVAYLGLLCLTPSSWQDQFGRYLMPLTPFLVLSLFEALLLIKTETSKVLPSKWKFAGTALSILVISLILLLQVFTLYFIYKYDFNPVAYNNRAGQRIEYRQFYYGKNYQSLDEAIDWLMVNGQPDGVVVGWPAPWIYVRTGLKAVLPPFESDANKAQHLLDTVPAKYLLLEKDTVLNNQNYITFLRNGQGKWKLIFTTTDGDWKIYEREN